MNFVITSLIKTKAKEVIIILDTCFSGLGTRSVSPNQRTAIEFIIPPIVNHPHYKSNVQSHRFVVLMTASGKNEVANITQTSPVYGLFTYWFVKGLGLIRFQNESIIISQNSNNSNYKKTISITNVFKWIKDKIDKYNKPYLQHPELKLGDKMTDFCIAEIPLGPCPKGKIMDLDTKGNCCFPGQIWSDKHHKCLTPKD